MTKAAVAIALTVAERRDLEGFSRRRKTAQGLARRARIVLLAAEGLFNKEIAAAAWRGREHGWQMAPPVWGTGP